MGVSVGGVLDDELGAWRVVVMERKKGVRVVHVKHQPFDLKRRVRLYVGVLYGVFFGANVARAFGIGAIGFLG